MIRQKKVLKKGGSVRKEIAPGASGGGKTDPYTLAQILTDVGGPLLYQALTGPMYKDALNKSAVQFKLPDLYAGTVHDLAQPDFAAPARNPTGSSLMEQTRNQAFRDIMQRNAETNYALTNEQSRVQQEGNIQQNQNRNNAILAQILNSQIGSNASFNRNLAMMGLSDRTSTYESLFGNVSKDISEMGYLNSMQKIMNASEIVRNPERYGGLNSDVYKNASQYITGGFARGGKMSKAKSKAKRKTKLSY